jgi:hypothetical protein
MQLNLNSVSAYHQFLCQSVLKPILPQSALSRFISKLPYELEMCNWN